MTEKQGRSNAHMTFNPVALNPITHLFGTGQSNVPQDQLIDMLDKRALPYQFYIDYEQLQEVCENRQGGTKAAVLLTSFQNEKMLKQELDRGLVDKAVKGKVMLYSYPNHIRGSEIKNLSNLEQFLKIYQQPKKQKNSSIKLSAVHSISKKNASSKSITKISNDSEYRTVTYYEGFGYNIEDSILYRKISEILASDSHYEPFASVESAIGKAAKQDSHGQKVCVIAPVSMGDEICKKIKKYNKQAMIDVILIGQPETNKMVLERSIVLATSFPDKLHQYFQEKKILDPNLMKMFYERLITKSNTNQNNSNAQGTTIDPFARIPSKEMVSNPMDQNMMQTNVQQVIVEPPKAQQNNAQGSEYQINSVSKIQDESEKKKVRKIKSPTKNRPNFQAETNGVNVSINTPAPGSIIETNQFYTNKQGERIPKKSFTTTTTTNVVTGPNVQYVSPPKGFTPRMSTQGENQFNQKSVVSNNNSKFKSSYIIQETSDQYRGSNKDSIVNLEPEVKSKFLTNIQTTGPLEQGYERRVVTNVKNNYPESRYVQSSEVIKEGSRVVYNQIKPAVEQVNRNYNTITYSQGYQSPLKVIKKGQTSLPEEIKNESLKHIEEYRGTFGASKPSNYVQPSGSSSSYNYSSYNRGPNAVTQTVTQSLNPQTVQTITTTKIGNNLNNGKVVVGGSGSIVNGGASNSISSVGGSVANNYNSSVSGNGGYTLGSTVYKGGNGVGVYSGVNGNIVSYGGVGVSQSNSPGKIVYQAGGINSVSGVVNSLNNNYGVSRELNVNNYNSLSNYKYGENVVNTKMDKKQYGSVQLNSNNDQNKHINNVVRAETSKYSPSKFNLEGYERVEVNGITMYRKKTEAANISTPSNARATIKQQENMLDSSPKVMRYQYSPRRNGDATYTTTTIQNQGIQPQRYSTYNYNSYSSRPEEKSVTNQVLYNNPKGDDRVNVSSSTYQYNSINSLPQQIDRGAVNEDRFITSVPYKVGQFKDKMEVTRRQYNDNKLQMVSPSSRGLNDSNWQSKASDFYSDGSILRRNNIRFGVKYKKKEDKLNDMSVNQSKMLSGLFKVKDLNKKMALNRVIIGEEELVEQQSKYIQINPWICATHFLIQQDLRYLQSKLKPNFGINDKIDSFNCLQEVFQKANVQLDCGFIIVSESQGKKINAGLIPEDYYIIFIQREQALLQINQSLKQIKMDSFQRLTLAQKIILDSKLYQYVSFTGGDTLVQDIGDKFNNTQYITQKLQIQLSCQMLDCYYYEQPRLTRLYFICLQQELTNIFTILDSYEQMNPAFNKSSCKIVCPLPSNVGITRLKSQYPGVVFLQKYQNMTYRDVIIQAHRNDRQVVLNIKLDRLYIHEKHQFIANDVEKEFPGRFQFTIFKNMAELAKKIVNYKKGDFQSYLVLHESCSGQKITVDKFTRVFMMGRAKTIQSNVVRVMKKDELIELLKK